MYVNRETGDENKHGTDAQCKLCEQTEKTEV